MLLYCPGASSLLNPLTGSSAGHAPLTVPTNPQQLGLEKFYIYYFSMKLFPQMIISDDKLHRNTDNPPSISFVLL